jgi:hypothetical protein
MGAIGGGGAGAPEASAGMGSIGFGGSSRLIAVGAAATRVAVAQRP